MKKIVKVKSNGCCYKYDQHPLVIKKKDLVLKDPLAGKSGGTGLDDYNLDVMILE